MEVDVVLLHEFAAIVEFFVLSHVWGVEFPACKGSHRFFVRQDAIQAIPFAGVIPGVFFLDKLLLGAVLPAIHGRPPVNGNLLCLGHLQDMGVQLVGQDAHDAVGELPETHGPEKFDHAAWKEKPPDVSPQDDAIEATVFELDIRRELLHKGILHGRLLPIGRFLDKTSHIGLPVKNQSPVGGAEKRIEVHQDGK